MVTSSGEMSSREGSFDLLSVKQQLSHNQAIKGKSDTHVKNVRFANKTAPKYLSREKHMYASSAGINPPICPKCNIKYENFLSVLMQLPKAT